MSLHARAVVPKLGRRIVPHFNDGDRSVDPMLPDWFTGAWTTLSGLKRLEKFQQILLLICR